MKEDSSQKETLKKYNSGNDTSEKGQFEKKGLFWKMTSLSRKNLKKDNVENKKSEEGYF